MNDSSGSRFSKLFKKISQPGTKDTSDKASGWVAKGVDLASQGRHKEAICCHKKALKLDPDDENAWLNLALSEDQLGNLTDAVHSYEQFMLYAPEEHIKVIFHVMQRLHALGVTDIASDFRKLNNGVVNTVGSKEKLDPHEARTWFLKGRVFLYLGKYEDAINCFDQSLKVDSTLTLSWNGKGSCLKILGRYKDAILCFDQALALDPCDTNAWINKGESLNNLGRYEDAILCFDQALIFDPNAVMSWYNKALAENNLGKLQEAAHSFHQFLGLAPEQLSNEIKYARKQLQEFEGK